MYYISYADDPCDMLTRMPFFERSREIVVEKL